jgi:hypothetical protein
VEYRPNTSNIMKIGHAKCRSHIREEG